MFRVRARKLRKRTESHNSSPRARLLRLGSANRQHRLDGSGPCVSMDQWIHFRRAVLHGRCSGWSTPEISHRSGRGEASLGPSQLSESEFPPCASAASKVRARPLSGRADVTFRGLRGEVLRGIGNRSIRGAWWHRSFMPSTRVSEARRCPLIRVLVH